MMEEKLYIVSPKLNDWIGKAEFIPDIQFPWSNVSVAPKVDVHFTMKVTWKRLKEIDVDYFRSVTPIVSEKFADICREASVDCQLVPLDVVLNGRKIDDKFYFILLNDFISIVDEGGTPHQRMMRMDGGGYEINPFFPEIPKFDVLENIVFNGLRRPPFFMAPEIGNKRVCTQEFKDQLEGRGVKGVEFKLIDKSFRYESFGFQ